MGFSCFYGAEKVLKKSWILIPSFEWEPWWWLCLFVCLFVCLSVCVSAHINVNRMAELHQTFCACCLWPWLGPPLMALLVVVYFWFYGWHYVFVLWGQWARIKCSIMFRRISPGDDTSWMSDNYSVRLSSSECGTGDEICYLRLTCCVYDMHNRWGQRLVAAVLADTT